MALTKCRTNTLVKLSLAFNAFTLLYYSFDNTTVSKDDILNGFQARRKALASWYNTYRSLPSPSDNVCSINILLFGMKQHWLQFCKFPEMAHYGHLVDFPRTFYCPEVNCTVTLMYSQEQQHVHGPDIVVFTDVYKWLTHEQWTWTHGNRSDSQPWVMISLESPLYVPGLRPPPQYRDTSYNWIASYKFDSEIHLPYGFYEPYGENKPPDVDLKMFLANKTKLIAWMSSNCDTLQWDRRRLVEEISQIIHVDTFGKCGDVEVPWNDDKALRDVLGNYKFYLSFENSCCDDYITEKFWRALGMGLVPVVVGASYDHYRKVAPPNSFIHVDQFDSLSDLAIHLTLASNNDEKYLEYLQWKNMGKVTFYSQEEQYIRPLTNETHCRIVQQYLKTNRTADKTIEYMGKRWAESCTGCGSKWIQTFHQKNFRQND
ncbi:Alpha-(1,3)-fucosyltransferase 4 [Holothuria leucospilota]|uniref:Fucosyltransferase n=1 Tax=Holothuria leucospilota TaxID=206669 RepID=A0A9Q0YH41_HOLLE|nr:Alpha-(1,3)-fucosyltransferase 4 [Holothuria leucospilota]